jgi:hypothetical protein
MSWTVSVIIICSLLIAFTIMIEYRREDSSRLIWRILATLIAVAALACIAFPFTYNAKAIVNSDNAVLLTEGFSADSINYGYSRFFTIDKNIKKTYPKVVLLTGVQDINSVQPTIKQLHITGYGLNTVNLQQLNGIPVVYNSPVPPQGIIAVNWQQNINVGDVLQVQGKYNNTSSKPIKLLFKGLNTSLDSVIVPAAKTTDFTLTTTPKITGRASYSLFALNSKDTVEKENVAVNIEPAKSVKILMLLASPDFETKFLKNWLSQNGYAVASRSIITRGKTSQDFVNMPKQGLDQLNPALLTQFDVVIGDLSVLKTLPGPESYTLKQQVQSGLGVIVRADSTGKDGSWLQNDFKVSTLSSKTLSIPLILQGQKYKTSPLNIDPSYISDGNNLQNLVTDAQNHILATSTLNGEGKLVFTTLHTTYTWVLGGSDKDYSALWSLLINKAARKTPPIANWNTEAGIATINEPVNLQLQSGSIPSKLTINNAMLSPQQNPFTVFNWTATYWPQSTGWQQITMGSGISSWWYTYQQNSWRSIRNLQTSAETKNYADNKNNFQTVTKQIQQSAAIEVPKMYFYLILIAACTFLWVERKLTA